MANPESKKLAVDVIARVDKLERELKKASRAANDNFSKIERRGKKMGDRLEKDLGGAATRIGGIFKNFGAGLLAGVAAGGVTGAVAALHGVANSVAAIGDEARRAGITTRVFQEWKAVAEQARIPVDAMVDSFKELNIRADEFATTGKGSAAEAFARLGLTPAEVKERLKDPADLMLLLIDRTRQLNDTAAATRIFDELFGGTGAERLVTLLDQSNDSIRATIDQAHRLGNVLDDEVIARAAEVDRQFALVTQTVGTALKRAIVDAASALQGFIDKFKEVEAQQTRTLETSLTEIGRERLEIENEILAVREKQDAITGVLAQAERRQLDGTIATLEQKRAALAKDEERILGILKARETPTVTSPGSTFTPTPYTPPPPSGGSKRDSGAAAAEREAEAVRRLIGELEHELRLVGATDLERETANALRQAGAAATEEQRAKIVSLVAALEAEETATRNATEAAQELRDIGKDVLGGIISDLRQGTSAADILANALGRVADRLVDIALNSIFDGGGGAFFGTAGRFGIAANDNHYRRAA